MNYNIKKESSIIYCILNNIENQSSTYSKEVARNVSDFFLSLLLRKNYDIIIDDTTDKLLQRVSNDNFYTHAVVVITGTHTGLSERLIKAIENKCKEDFTIAGHILDRGDAYYEIHNQFFIVNLQEYKRLGCPNMGEVSWHEEHIKVKPTRSEEVVNDDSEIPVWIKEGTETKVYQHKRHGWNFIDIGLKNNAKFCDVGSEIRDEKKYLYYEYDHVFFRHVPDLFNYELICNNMVTPWNSDGIPESISANEKIDHYVTTGTGLNWVSNLLKLSYHSKTKITFMDISYPVLSFMKALVEEWDGTDYASFYMKQLKFVPHEYNLDLKKHEENIRKWFIEFQNKFYNFQSIWNEIKQLKFDFVLIDFFANKGMSFINSDEVTFVNVSDAFNYVPYVHSAPVKFRVARENALITTLQKISPNIYFHMPTRLGHIYKTDLSEQEKINFGKISDFCLWDINEFNCPPWQKENWKSYCPITGSVKIV